MWWHTPAVPVLRGWAKPILNYTGRPWKGGGREEGEGGGREESGKVTKWIAIDKIT